VRSPPAESPQRTALRTPVSVRFKLCASLTTPLSVSPISVRVKKGVPLTTVTVRAGVPLPSPHGASPSAAVAAAAAEIAMETIAMEMAMEMGMSPLQPAVVPAKTSKTKMEMGETERGMPQLQPALVPAKTAAKTSKTKMATGKTAATKKALGQATTKERTEKAPIMETTKKASTKPAAKETMKKASTKPASVTSSVATTLKMATRMRAQRKARAKESLAQGTTEKARTKSTNETVMRSTRMVTRRAPKQTVQTDDASSDGASSDNASSESETEETPPKRPRIVIRKAPKQTVRAADASNSETEETPKPPKMVTRRAPKKTVRAGDSSVESETEEIPKSRRMVTRKAPKQTVRADASSSESEMEETPKPPRVVTRRAPKPTVASSESEAEETPKPPRIVIRKAPKQTVREDDARSASETEETPGSARGALPALLSALSPPDSDGASETSDTPDKRDELGDPGTPSPTAAAPAIEMRRSGRGRVPKHFPDFEAHSGFGSFDWQCAPDEVNSSGKKVDGLKLDKILSEASSEDDREKEVGNEEEFPDNSGTDQKYEKKARKEKIAIKEKKGKEIQPDKEKKACTNEAEKELQSKKKKPRPDVAGDASSFVGRPVAKQVEGGTFLFGKVSTAKLVRRETMYSISYDGEDGGDAKDEDVTQKMLWDMLDLYERKIQKDDVKDEQKPPEYDSSTHTNLIQKAIVTEQQKVQQINDEESDFTDESDADSFEYVPCNFLQGDRTSSSTIRDFLARAPPLIPAEKRKLLDEIPSLPGNSMWTSLDSAEPENGYRYLVDSACVHGLVPSGKNLGGKILDLIFNGPKSEGQSFKDPNRSELAVRYGAVLSSRFPASRYLNGAWVGCTWDHVEKCLRAACGACGSNGRMEFRLSEAASSLEFLVSVLGDDIVGPGATAGDTDASAFRGRPAYALFSPLGLRESTKVTFRWLARTWAKYAPMVGERGDEHCTSKMSHNANRCLMALGKLACLISWVFCSTQGYEMDNENLSLLIKDVLLTEFQNLPRSEQKSLLLSVLLSMDADYAYHLQIFMGEVLEMTSDLQMCGIF